MAIQNYSPESLYTGQPGTTEGALTLRPFNQTLVPAGQKVIIKQVVVTNTTSSPAKVSLSCVPSGGTAGAANRLFKDLNIEANSFLVVEFAQVMNAGDFLSASQLTSGAITLSISGAVVS